MKLPKDEFKVREEEITFTWQGSNTAVGIGGKIVQLTHSSTGEVTHVEFHATALKAVKGNRFCRALVQIGGATVAILSFTINVTPDMVVSVLLERFAWTQG